jgi:hypothetical protein
MKWIKARLRRPGARFREMRVLPGTQACCVTGCAASCLVTVASRPSTTTMMCLGHARQWVDSDGCWRIAEDAAGGIEANLSSWIRARRRGARSRQSSLRVV